MRKVLLGAILLLGIQQVFAQLITPEEYVATYKDLAIREMKRMGVPAAIKLAQGILETENGNSELLKNSNNHFGIKCKSTWTGGGYNHDDDAPGECFRVYKNAEESYRDHSNFLRGSDRYAFLFKLDPLDYKGWAYGLKRAGYATNNKYPQILIKYIEQYNLQQYSKEGISDMPDFKVDKYKSDPEISADISNAENKNLIDIKQPTNSSMDVPDKINEINGLKYVLAKKGTSLLAIASKNNLELSKLLEFNDLGEDGLLVKDQPIFLQKKSKTGVAEFYVSLPGETLYDVAQKNGIQFQYLLEYNNLQANDKLGDGTKLFLKPKLKLAGPEKNNSTEVKYYLVQPKEGLYSIAKKNGVNVQQLKEWNNLTSDSVRIGQQLIISRL
jgi:LysM repeat protein